MNLEFRPDTLCAAQWLHDAVRLLISRLEQAAGELDRSEVVIRTKCKTEAGEETVERREFEAGGVVDVRNLKQLTAALKDLRDLCCLLPPGEAREQELKLRLLEQQLEGRQNAAVTVTMEGALEEFCL